MASHRIIKIVALAAALVAVAVVVLLALGGRAPDPRPGSPEPEAGRSGAPRLVGSWFVRYLSDPKAYLDVALDVPVGVELASVTANLTGPARTYPDIQLQYNPKDGEWQMPSDPLPTPLAGGTWWVSRVSITTKAGQWLRYHAEDPFGTYRLDRGGPRGAAASGQATPVWIGSFYATEPDPTRPRFTVHTFPAPGGDKSNPILQIYRPADPKRWIAVNDDPDVNQDYARVSLPLDPGKTYLIRVDDRYHELGDYCLQINRSPKPDKPGKAAPAGTHPGEPDETHKAARPIKEGEVRCLTFGRRAGSTWGDEDWLAFSVPPSP